MSKWLLWKFITKYVARSKGFIDPMSLYSQLQRFSQPAEVSEPVELLRAGVVMHARGLINSKVIQHNLDWVWPYWIERQFDPADKSFLPRAFSITHINLTHRNWSAIGLPGVDALPIVDPRGLLTPFWDGWSLDAWIVLKNSDTLLPSKVCDAEQTRTTDSGHSIVTLTESDGMTLSNRAELIEVDGRIMCRMTLAGQAPSAGWLVVSLRPYNPEGVSFIHSVEVLGDRKGWSINDENEVFFSEPVDRHHTSTYRDADVYIHLLDKEDSSHAHCNVGMATAAAMFELQSDECREMYVDVPIGGADTDAMTVAPQLPDAHVHSAESRSLDHAKQRWDHALVERSRLVLPDSQVSFLYESALRTLVLCSPGDVYAGPYTYKRFWYRDAVFVAHGLLSAGLISRAEMIICAFPERQRRNGYFHSQEGEWDSNGEVLWLIARFCRMTNRQPNCDLWQSIEQAAEWIVRKRLPEDTGLPWAGLLPAGFSAEHLGPNDYYYWDNFWSVAGLEGAAWLADFYGHPERSTHYRIQANSLMLAISNSLDNVELSNGISAVPAAPTRRMDAGAIGSVVAGYPLQLYPPADPKLNATVNFLLDNCFYQNGFFQDMIHSGVNAYLTLHVAQSLLRIGDSRYLDLMNAVANVASPTGNWPEAVHPQTAGGCMGDGQHAWAAAEWVAMIRNCFVREEGETLVIGSGIASQWLVGGQECSYGAVPTCFGPISVSIELLETNRDEAQCCQVSWSAQWHHDRPDIIVVVPGYESVNVTDQENVVVLQQEVST